MKTFDFKLWLAFVLILLIPSTVNMVRLHFIGHMPSEWGFNIASQIQWLNVLYEILKEALLMPLFFMLATALRENREKLLNNVVGGLLWVLLIHAALSLLVFLGAENLVRQMGQSSHLLAETTSYIQLESLAIMLAVGTEYLIVYLAIIKDYRRLIYLSLLKTSLLIVADMLLISDWSFSLQLGVRGIALSNILINGTLTLFILGHGPVRSFLRRRRLRLDGAWFRHWLHLGCFSGAESLVRNGVFIFMILGMVNQTGAAGNYWIANGVIWGILLVPSLALAEVVQRDVALNPAAIHEKTPFYFQLTFAFILLWLASMPLWEIFLVRILQIKDPAEVLHIMRLQTFFYLTFMVNNGIFDATIKGLGITRYMLYQSFCIDIIYYGLIFIAYQWGFITMTLSAIALIFGIGMLLDLLPTLWLYKKALEERHIPLPWRRPAAA